MYFPEHIVVFFPANQFGSLVISVKPLVTLALALARPASSVSLRAAIRLFFTLQHLREHMYNMWSRWTQKPSKQTVVTSERLLQRVNFHHVVALCQLYRCEEAKWRLTAATAKLRSHRQRGGSISIWRREVTACSPTHSATDAGEIQELIIKKILMQVM